MSNPEGSCKREKKKAFVTHTQLHGAMGEGNGGRVPFHATAMRRLSRALLTMPSMPVHPAPVADCSASYHTGTQSQHFLRAAQGITFSFTFLYKGPFHSDHNSVDSRHKTVDCMHEWANESPYLRICICPGM